MSEVRRIFESEWTVMDVLWSRGDLSAGGVVGASVKSTCPSA